jgi:hypothetical protein
MHQMQQIGICDLQITQDAKTKLCYNVSNALFVGSALGPPEHEK